MRAVGGPWRAFGSRDAARRMPGGLGLFAALVVVFGVGLGVELAAQASPPANNGQLTCGTDNRAALHATCTLVFADAGTRTGYGATPAAGHTVCFSTPSPNVVTGTSGKCSTTDTQGRAHGTFTAKKAGAYAVTAAETYQSTDEGAVKTTVTVTTVPGAPTSVSAFPYGDHAAKVFWHPPTSTGGAVITGYAVKPFLGSSAQPVRVFNSSKASSAVIAGLEDGQPYRFQVAARNANGTGPYSALTAAMIAGAPGEPGRAKAVSLGRGELQVSFTAPSNDGAPITSYHARCRSTDGGATVHRSGTASPVTVTGATAAKHYTCAVTATNSRGRGPASRPSPVVTTRP